MHVRSALGAMSTSVLILLAACGGDDAMEPIPPGTDGGITPPPPPTDVGGISIDTSATDPYVVGFPGTWPVAGHVDATRGVGHVVVAGTDLGASPDFRTDVAVSPGMTLVEIEATDTGEPPASRKGHRSLLSADFLPEGQRNPVAAALPLTDEILATMASGLADRVTGLDLAADIRSRPTIMDDEMCTLSPTDASHGTPALHLAVREDGTLGLLISVPDLQIAFRGTCTVLGGTHSVTGDIHTTIQIATALSPAADREPGSCLSAFDHGDLEINLDGFGVSLHGIGEDLLTGWLVDLIASGVASDMARTRMAEEIRTTATGLLASELTGISVLDVSETMSLFGTDIDVALCLTDLVTTDGQLVAEVGATATGPGGMEAPGAPTLPGELPPPAPGTLYLDANLVGQLVFSAWRAGALNRPDVSELDVAVLGFLSPELRSRYAGKTLVVDMDARLPPAVTASTTDEGDLVLHVGDMHLFLKVEGETVFELGAQLDMVLELTPVEGGLLQPTLVSADATAWLISEPIVDVDDNALEGVVAAQVGTQASGLFDGTTIALPDLGGIIVPGDVTGTEGGRYLAVSLGGAPDLGDPPPAGDTP